MLKTPDTKIGQIEKKLRDMFEIYWVYVLVFLLGVHEIYLFNRRFTKFGGKDFGFLKYKKSDSTGIPPMW